MRRIPKQVWSQHGMVPVRFDKDACDRENKRGYFDTEAREIILDPRLKYEAKLQTLFHEIVHLALHDTGASNLLTGKVEETICDGVGGYFASSFTARTL